MDKFTGIYRFPKTKDASWNSYERQYERYRTISPFLGENSIGAEIGVYKGGFGEFLKNHCKLLYLVDPWYRLGTHWGEKTISNSRGLALRNILSVYANEIDNGSIQIITDYSVNFLQSLKPGHLDFVYLDASHAYQLTYVEIKESLRAVKSKGFVIGDDYDPLPESPQHGVYLAVNQIIKEFNLILKLNRSRQWALQVP